ncbi:MAG: dihydrodipicolinate synthase family protein [Clostridia bacterium]|nr:dihydrodipicolinate synthase family protein [Clostridia bacterium]
MKTNIYVPLITPFKENFEVDYEGLARATKFVLAKGADGIYACGGSSEFTLLTTEERKRCLEVIIANAEGKDVIAHVGSQSGLEAVALAKHAYEAGACMLSAVAPYYFGYSFAQVKEYFHSIAHATPLSLMIYSAAQARPYSIAELKELLDDEKISSVKYTGYDFYTLERLIRAYPNKKFYTGADEAFLAGQAVGADGAIGTTYNYYADKYILARELFGQGKNKEALDIIHKLNDITEALLSGGTLLAATKYMMTLQGLDILPISRPPFTPLEESVKARLKEVLEATRF